MKRLIKSIFLIFFIFIQLQIWGQAPYLQVVTHQDESVQQVPIILTPITSDVQHEKIMFTNQEGKVFLPVSGTFRLIIKYHGYASITDTITVNSDYTPITYTLQPVAATLAVTVVTLQLDETTPDNAIHKVKVISKEKIEQMGAVNLRDALTNETNIRISQDNILGSSISIQGISGQNVKILIDGVPVIGRLNGNIDLSQINMENVERIEIIEGPAAVSYGTNAMAGTINIITKKHLKKVNETHFDSYLESVGKYNLHASSSWRRKNHMLFFGIGRNYFDGWSEYDTESRFKQWKPKEQYNGRFKYYRSWKNTSIDFTNALLHETIVNKGVPRSPFYITAFDDYYITKRIDNSLAVEHFIKNKNRLNLTFAYNYYRRNKNTYFTDLTTLEKEVTADATAQDTSTFDLVLLRGIYTLLQDSSKINAQLGYDVNIESAYGVRIENKKQRIGDYAIFSNLEWSPSSSLALRSGLRIGYNSKFNAPIIPSLHLKYKVKNATWRASWAKGFRAPTLKELHFFFVDINHNISGNEELKAERGHNVQTSWSITNKKNSITSEIGAFYNHITNMITLAQTSEATAFSYINVGLYKTAGIQSNFSYQIKKFKANLGGTYMKTYNKLSENTSASAFSYTGEWRTSVSYTTNKEYTFALFYKYNGKQPGFYLDENDNLQNSFIGSYSTLDFSANKSLWKDRLTLTLGAKNILDVKNVNAQFQTGSHSASTSNTPVAWGRSYFIKCSLNL